MIPGPTTGRDLDGARSARLMFVHELSTGVVHHSQLDTPAVLAASRVRDVPLRPLRIAQQVGYKFGRLGFERQVAGPLLAARRSVLGERASGPPRFLLRVDEFPHYLAWDDQERFGTARFERFHEIMSAAGVPYLLAVLPRMCHEPLTPVGGVLNGDGSRARGRHGDFEGPTLGVPAGPPSRRVPAGGRGDFEGPTLGAPAGPPSWRVPAGGRGDGDSRPLDDGERSMLARLASERVTFALHGLTHRTRFASPRRHSELCGLSAEATAELLDTGLAELARAGLSTDVFVPPYNRFDAAQFAQLAQRFRVVCGGPESIGGMGFQGTPQWRGESVYLPSYAPFYGHAAEVLPAVEHAIEAGWGLWVPVVLHWGWEADAGWADLERLVRVLAPYTAAWEDFIAAVDRSKDGDPVYSGEHRRDSGTPVASARRSPGSLAAPGRESQQ